MQDAAKRAQQAVEQVEKTGAKFLITDLGLAMTMIHIASDADVESEKRARNQANARHAYDDVSRIRLHVPLSEHERQDVDHRLAELRSALEELGEVFA